MNNKIKKIMKNMKEWSVDGNLYFEIDYEQAKLLYEYITKLEKENARLKALEESITFEELLKHKGEYYLSMVESQRLRK